MSQLLSIISTILLCLWACHCFYLVCKRHKDSDDPLLDVPIPLILELILTVISWLAEKFLPKLANIILFKIFCFLWGLLLLLVVFILWTI